MNAKGEIVRNLAQKTLDTLSGLAQNFAVGELLNNSPEMGLYYLSCVAAAILADGIMPKDKGIAAIQNFMEENLKKMNSLVSAIEAVGNEQSLQEFVSRERAASLVRLLRRHDQNRRLEAKEIATLVLQIEAHISRWCETHSTTGEALEQRLAQSESLLQAISGRLGLITQQLTIMTQERQRLQVVSERAATSASFLAEAVAGIKGMLLGFASNFPQFATEANKLECLLQDFHLRFAGIDLQAEESITLRLCAATSALVRGEFTKVIELITINDQVSTEAFSEQAREREVEVYSLRGQALCELNRLDEASKCLEQARNIDPKHVPSRLWLARTRLKQGRPTEALDLVEPWLRKVLAAGPDNDQRRSKSFAYLLGFRAAIYGAIGKLHDAIDDLGKAIEIRNNLLNLDGDVEEKGRLADALKSRSIILGHVGNLSDSAKDIETSIKLYREIDEKETSPESQRDLAMAIVCRGITIAEGGNPADAVPEFSSAIDILSKLVISPGGTKYIDNLATALGDRASSLFLSKRLPEALADYDKAISIRETQLDPPAGSELNLALVLCNRGSALSEAGRHVDGLDDLNRAITIYQKSTDQPTNHENRYSHAVVLFKRGEIYSKLAKFREAREDLKLSSEMCNRLNATADTYQVNRLLSRALFAHAHTYLEEVAKGRRPLNAFPPDTLKDLELCIEIIVRLKMVTERKSFVRELVRANVDRALILANTGRTDAALKEYDNLISLLKESLEIESEAELGNLLDVCISTRSRIQLGSQGFVFPESSIHRAILGRLRKRSTPDSASD